MTATTKIPDNYRRITLNVPGVEPVTFYVAMPCYDQPNFIQHWRSLNAFKHREMARAWGKDYTIHKQIVFCDVDNPNQASVAFSLQRGKITQTVEEQLPVIDGLKAFYERIGYDMARQRYLPDKYEQLPLLALK